MFEELALLTPTKKSIALSTHRNTPIDNDIALEPTFQELNLNARLLKKFYRWEPRRPPGGVYNCIGHVWASRRTSVFDNAEKQVMTIFSDDNYRILSDEEEPWPGDIITYWGSKKDHTNFIHVGVVFELRDGVSGSTVRIPWILSKWNSALGEVLHSFKDHPFLEHLSFLDRMNSDECQVEFWTDRPSASSSASRSHSNEGENNVIWRP